MKTLRVEVTAEDIAVGCPMDICGCPIARAAGVAVASQLSPDIDCDVAPCSSPDGDWALTLYLDPGQIEIRLPDAAAEFARRFDEGLPVEPFSFDVEIPEEVRA